MLIGNFANFFFTCYLNNYLIKHKNRAYLFIVKFIIITYYLLKSV